MWPHKVLHSRYSAEVSTPSQNRALSKPMQKACTAKRERHFELSANGMAENRPRRQYALAALAICSRRNFCRSDGDCPKTALLNRVIRWDQFAPWEPAAAGMRSAGWVRMNSPSCGGRPAEQPTAEENRCSNRRRTARRSKLNHPRKHT
jgi:hypothetical protein